MDEETREIVILNPEVALPRFNFMGTENFFSVVTHTAGGCVFFKDAHPRRLTGYRYSGCPMDMGGRYLYIRDGEKVWNPGWQPVRARLDRYECRHGLGYTVIRSACAGLSAEFTIFVPVQDDCEADRVVLRNESSETKEIDLYSLLDFTNQGTQDDMSELLHGRPASEVLCEGSTFYHFQKQRRDDFCFTVFGANAPALECFTDLDAFVGLFNGFDRPQAVFDRDFRPEGEMLRGLRPAGVHHFRLRLEPGQSRSIIFVIGCCSGAGADGFPVDRKAAANMLDRYASDEQFGAALQKRREFWRGVLSCFHLKSGGRFDSLANELFPYESMEAFTYGRIRSSSGRGLATSVGYCDSCQDTIGIMHLTPERARAQIVVLAKTLAGKMELSRHFPLGRPDLHVLNYDPVWFIECTCRYLKETGDIGLLDEQCTVEDTAAGVKTVDDILLDAFNYAVSHKESSGLPAVSLADYCGSDPEKKISLENLAAAMIFISAGHQYAELCRFRAASDEGQGGNISLRSRCFRPTSSAGAGPGMGDQDKFRYQDEARLADKEVSDMCRAVILNCRYGADPEADQAAGEFTQSRLSELQTAEKEAADSLSLIGTAMTLIRDRLIGEDRTDARGDFPERGMLAVMSCALLGEGDMAWDLYQRSCPLGREEESRFGISRNASWLFKTLCQYIVGIRPHFTGLKIDPCLPSKPVKFRVDRYFRGVCYHITIDNQAGVTHRVRRITVDGQEIKGRILPLILDKDSCEVIVEMG